MSFDINKTGAEMVEAMVNVLAGKWPNIKETVQTIMTNEQETLSAIAEARINGDIDDEEMKDKLKQEKEVLKIGLLAVAIGGKKAVQDAVNAALNIFWKAVQAALKFA